jgi:NADH:ubiquinone oxidoreductase subunit 2 (subunit N)
VSSFSILVFFLLSYKYLLFISLFLKLGIFPFFSWYLNVLYRFSTFILFLSLTFHKIPAMYIFYIIFEPKYLFFLYLIRLFSLLVSSIYMLFLIDLRYLIIVSSAGNNSFIVFSVISNHFVAFSVFYAVYTLTVFLLLSTFSRFATQSKFYSYSYIILVFYLFLLLLNLGAFPPLPRFFTKFFVFFTLIFNFPNLSFYFILVLVSNVAIIVSYLLIFNKYLINIFRCKGYLAVY